MGTQSVEWRSRGIGACILALALLLAGNASARRQEPKPGAIRLNVLLVTVDDLSTRLGCYGDPVVTSPNVDRLSRRGVRFDRAYCQYPLCNPSRTSFLSGRRPATTGVTDNETRPRLPNAVYLPQHFRSQGYFTARVGKIFHRDEAASWDLSEGGEARTPEEEAARRARYDRPEGQRTPDWAVLTGGDEATTDGTIARRVAQLMEQASRQEKPFFLAAGFHKPHLPWTAPRKYFDLYPQSRVPLPSAASVASIPKIALMTELSPAPEPQPKWQAVAAYSACTSFMDAQLGILLDAMDRLRLWDRTVVVFLGDHGFNLGDHGGLWGKLTLFEQCARVPLIVAAPGARRGETSPRLVELVDLYPTLTALCQLPAPPKLEGTSLAPLLSDPQRAWKRAAFSEVVHQKVRGRSARTDRWRYTAWEDGSEELYDHRNDPDEYRNLAASPERRNTAAELKRILEAGWRGAIPDAKQGQRRHPPRPPARTLAGARNHRLTGNVPP